MPLGGRPVGRVGLISLYVIESNGIRYLSAALRTAGIDTDEYYIGYHLHHVVRELDETDLAMLLQHMRQRGISIVGLSVRIGALLPQYIQLTQRIRRELDIPVIWGGAHVTMAPEECLEDADYLVLGESETALPDLVHRLNSGQNTDGLANVWYRRGSLEIRNSLASLNSDLDMIPFPDYTSHSEKFWIRDGRLTAGDPLHQDPVYRVMVTRGCKYNCGFCGVSAFRQRYGHHGPFYRRRSVDNVLTELEQARRHRPGIRRIRFDDELFIPDREWLVHFCREYPRRIGLPFDILTSPRQLDEWTIDILHSAGLDLVYLGVQTTSDVNIQRYNRTVPETKVLQCVHHLHRLKIRKEIQILIDDPDSTRAEKLALLDLLLAIPRPYDLLIYSLCHWPGTARTQELLDQGQIQPDQVEGRSNKVLRQFNADFSYSRPTEDTFFLALYILANKRGIPQSFIRACAASKNLLEHPEPLVVLAQLANAGKLIIRGGAALWRREISVQILRQWIGSGKFKSLPSI